MSAKKNQTIFELYKKEINLLNEYSLEHFKKSLLKTLLLRDEIHQYLKTNSKDTTPEQIQQLHFADRLLCEVYESRKLTLIKELRVMQSSDKTSWWWYLDEDEKKTTRKALIWRITTILFFSLSLSLALNISGKFLVGGIEIISTLVVVIQAVLTLFLGRGLLTKYSNQLIASLVKDKNYTELKIHFTKSIISISFFFIMVFFSIALPALAVKFNNFGLQKMIAGDLQTANIYLTRAVALDPDYSAAHYNLGLLNEKIFDYDEAKTHYKLATLGGLDTAYNNLARILILQNEDYSLASVLLLEGLEISEDKSVKASMYKNLAWARALQGRYNTARYFAEQSLSLEFENGPAHCLSAIALENLESSSIAKAEWELCVAYSAGELPEEDEWIGMAQEKIE